ncbi:hypothetical protein PENNAL_c0886G07135, partial [Penicillium nalgiovense]
SARRFPTWPARKSGWKNEVQGLKRLAVCDALIRPLWAQSSDTETPHIHR